MTQFRYCPDCGSELQARSVGGEPRKHWYCQRCQAPHHNHPRVVVTCFVASEQRLLWIQRKLPPKAGQWAIPGGFLENGETLAQGAAEFQLRERGFTFRVEQVPVEVGSSQIGTVISQSLAPGTQVPRGTEVVIRVGIEASPSTQPADNGGGGDN